MMSRTALALVAAVALTACGRASPPPAPSPGPSPGETITGRERLGWDQQAADAAEVASFGFAIYVDGTRAVVAGVSCAMTAGPAGFACSAPLPPLSPGAHTLELAAFTGAAPVLESNRSTPIQVLVAAGSRPGAPAEAERALLEAGRTIARPAEGIGLRVEPVAEGLDDPTDVAFGVDGRIWIAERAGRVRVLRDGRLAEALALDDVSVAGDEGLLALALDPRFDDTAFVFILYTAVSPDGPVFRVARYRAGDAALVDGVVILDDVPARPGTPAAALRFGPDDALYVALDSGGAAGTAGELADPRGKVLRLDRDGRTPADQPAATPVFSAGHDAPLALDWQPATGVLWVLDSSTPAPARLTAVAAGPQAPAGGVELAEVALPEFAAPSSLAFSRGRVIPELEGDLLVAAGIDRRLFRLRFDAREPLRVVSSEVLFDDAAGPVRVVAIGPDGAIYFCTRRELARLVK